MKVSGVTSAKEPLLPLARVILNESTSAFSVIILKGVSNLETALVFTVISTKLDFSTHFSIKLEDFILNDTFS